ncbi:MAG: UvrD-helicase domain-containing protein, partial [Candidatus Nanoarchaeia archaeon]
MKELNEAQKKAVQILEGNLLILASAGTGKTTTIVERYVNLVKNHGILPEEVMMTTFTNKAAKDMVEKIRA